MSNGCWQASELLVTCYSLRTKKAVFVDKDENGFRGTTLIQHHSLALWEEGARKRVGEGAALIS
jgi:hypothetical protein